MSQDLLTKVNEWFDSFTGEAISYRASQHQLAQSIAKAMSSKSKLIAEAGTGTGKTLAYLIPAIYSPKKTLISTGTKHLQDQIILKDLPQLQKLMPIQKRVALLKGRANYLCLYRVDNLTLEDDFFSDDKTHDLQVIKESSHQLTEGDISEIPGIAADAEVWPLVTSTSDNCLGTDCAYYDKCYLVKARRKALQADILIINHHLFFADLVMREEGFGELLPVFDSVIFDEAHQLAEVATHFFGERFSSRQIHYLIQDTTRAVEAQAADNRQILETGKQLQQAVESLLVFLKLFPNRGDWEDIKDDTRIQQGIKTINAVLDTFTKQANVLAERHETLANIHQRATSFKLQLDSALQADERVIHWYEVFRQSFVIHQTPIDVADNLKEKFTPQKAWIFTSATLSVNHSCDHFQSSLGIEEADYQVFASPFNFKQQAKLYIPPRLPDPTATDFLSHFVEAALPVINAASGRTFILCTSYRAMHEIETLLNERTQHPLLVQGSMAKPRLLKRFVDEGNAVLIGTTSFWEGVDVKGDALSCVIIEKLPFASPGDPITKAKLNYYRQYKLDPFNTYQLPKAVILLRQGIGRLIRDTADKGVLMIGDNRLIHRRYAKIFWQSLPKVPVTRCLDEIIEFLEHAEDTCV